MDIVTPGFGLIWWQMTGLAYLALWIYALIDLTRNEFKFQNQKLFWVLIILFVPFGCILYLANSRRDKKREFRPDFSKISKPKNP